MIKTEIQQLETDAKIDLFVVDLTPVGEVTVYRFYPGVDANYGTLAFNSLSYAPWPVTVTGFDRSGVGPQARPVLALGNATGYVSDQLPVFNDFVGAKVQRIRTFAKYLDGGASPDVTAFTMESYYVDRKKSETKNVVEFELATVMDFLNKQLPGRLMVANTCPWLYKGSADHPECTWPGTDSNKWFDRNGNRVFSANEDECGKRLFDCEIRFGDTPNDTVGFGFSDGTTAELPYGGFPTLGRVG